ncbi:hypothetical protein TNCV_1132981 [Trichonephila clavipes]|nr:hypothetical protein TNCV_1132981 [Trichonephila clavipes]
MTTKLVPPLEEMALLKIAVVIYNKLKIKKSEKGLRRILSGTPDDELPVIKEVVPKLEIPKCLQGKLKNMLTLMSFDRHRHKVEKRLLKDKKYSQGGKQKVFARTSSEYYKIFTIILRTS